MKIKILVTFILLVFACNQAVFSGTSSNGTTFGIFTRLFNGIRSSGMGDAYIAVSDDPDAVISNPAGFGDAKGPEFRTWNSSYIDGMNLMNFSSVIPVKEAGFGASFTYMDSGNILETTRSNPGGTGNSFGTNNTEATLGFSKTVNESFSFGVNTNYIRQEIGSSIQDGFGGDVGIKGKLSDKLSIGLCAKNIFGSFGEVQLTKSYGFGIAINNKPMLIATDIEYKNENDIEFKVGFEYTVNEMLSLRGGFTSLSVDSSKPGISAGIGYKMNGFKFDYAYIPYGDLGEAHRFGISYCFAPDDDRASKKYYSNSMVKSDKARTFYTNKELSMSNPTKAAVSKIKPKTKTLKKKPSIRKKRLLKHKKH